MVRVMDVFFTTDEVRSLLLALAGNTASLVTGAIGIALFVVSLFHIGSKQKQWARVLAVIMLITSPAYAWRDEFRKHNESRQASRSLESSLKFAQRKDAIKIESYYLGYAGKQHRFILDTNQTITPINLKVLCDREIQDILPRVLGANTLVMGGQKLIGPREREIDLNTAWFSNAPLLIEISNDNEAELGCSFSLR